MKKQIKHTLGKDERLKSRKVIEQLFKGGKTFALFPFRIFYLQGEDSSYKLKAGFSVSAKHFKKAVDRNRIKRLMRETYRLQKSDLFYQANNSAKSLSIFFIYVGKEIPEYTLIFEKMNAAIKQLQKQVNENSTANT